MRPWFAACAAAVIAAVVVPAGAQSLAEIAERNRKKEAEKGKPAAKVYTESDLRAGKAGTGSMSQMDGPVAVAASPAPGAGAPGASPAPGAPAKTEEEERAERETAWRERVTKANEDVTRIQGEIDRAQLALNDLSGPLYGGTRAGLITRLEEAQRQLVAAKKVVEDLQEEGRRARFRP